VLANGSFVGRLTCKAKVDDARTPVGGNDHVVWLEVTMDDALRVCGREASSYLYAYI